MDDTKRIIFDRITELENLIEKNEMMLETISNVRSYKKVQRQIYILKELKQLNDAIYYDTGVLQ